MSTNNHLEALRQEASSLSNRTVEEGINDLEKIKTKAEQLRDSNKDNPAFQKDVQDYIDELSKNISFLRDNYEANKKKLLRDAVSDLNTLSASSSAGVKTVEVATPIHPIEGMKVPEAIPYTMDQATQNELKEFQIEASKALSLQLLDENGQLRFTSLKEALEYLGELANLQNVVPGEGKFAWLEKDEKDLLLKQLPAVQGVVGSIFTKQFFNAGYDFGFNGDNTVVVKPKHGSQVTRSNEFADAINNEIRRNPSLANTLKAGLLYGDHDLLKYLQNAANSQGGKIAPEAQTSEKFLDYLKHPNTNAPQSDSARAILSSTNFFNGFNIHEHMYAASYVPDMSETLQVVMKNPDYLAKAANPENNPKNVDATTGATNTPSPSAYSSGTAAILGNTVWHKAKEEKFGPLPSVDESIEKHGLIG